MAFENYPKFCDYYSSKGLMCQGELENLEEGLQCEKCNRLFGFCDVCNTKCTRFIALGVKKGHEMVGTRLVPCTDVSIRKKFCQGMDESTDRYDYYVNSNPDLDHPEYLDHYICDSTKFLWQCPNCGEVITRCD